MTAQSLRDFVGAERVAALDAPTAWARGLPGCAYFSPEIYELERHSIFSKQWVAAAFATEIPNVGDTLPIRLAGWELLLVRAEDGAINCFHNICRHRGTKLVPAAGNMRTLRCGWHCWTYGLDGALINTPGVGGPRSNEVEGLEHEALGLRLVRTGVWHDIVFINIDGEAPPFESHIKPLDNRFGDFQLDLAKLGAATGEVELPCNWKIFLEGGLEGYHLPFVHPQLERPSRYEFERGAGGDCYLGNTAGLSKYEPAMPLFPNMEALRGTGQPWPYTILFVVPTAIVSVYPDYLLCTLVRPITLDRVGLRRRIYMVGEAATDAALAQKRNAMLQAWVAIAGEDSAYAEEVQRMSQLREDLDMPTRFSPYWEENVQAFQQYVVRNTK